MEKFMAIHEEARDIPIIHTCDICVVGGSCTGVFAAVRAAQLGVKVALVEKREQNPTFYQIPYRSLVPEEAKNVFVAGRLVDADRGAYGAIRVMVNCNQTGEAAGVACALALSDGRNVKDVDTDKLRESLVQQGAVII